MKNDLGRCFYKKVIEPLLSNDQTEKHLHIGFEQIFEKEETMKILFSDEKFFDIDGVYNSQKDRVWTGDRDDTDKKKR